MYRILNIVVLLSFFSCYIFFGHDGEDFIGNIEWFALTGAGNLRQFFEGLLIISPLLAGQIVLLAAAIRQSPAKKLSITGMVLLGFVVLMILVMGTIVHQANMIASTLSFIVSSLIFIAMMRTGRWDKGEALAE